MSWQHLPFFLHCYKNQSCFHFHQCSRLQIQIQPTGHLACVEVLLDRGASIDAAKNAEGASALFLAAQNGHDDVCGMLLGLGAQVGGVIF
jgi:ankyrin repeat protein